MKLNIKDTFNKELPADPNKNNTRRKVFEACYSYVTPRVPSNPKLVHVADDVAKLLGLEYDTNSSAFLNVFTGKTVYPKTAPFAMCYGGHQFGHWAGQLGDGRAINLAEIRVNEQHWALQLKGAGATPYSRTADGLAVLRSSIREHLCSEAMHYLGVPTTRSLSLALTGDEVLRDMLYDGNQDYEKGAVVCRVAPSFVRFGNFQILAARKDHKNLKNLADYTIRNFHKDIHSEGKEKYITFFQKVVNASLEMVIHWQRVGFVHGVMNTDNMSILGLTIDYGPYGWLEGYDPNWTPNTTDSQQHRYAYGNQPGVVLWNLVQLANALYPLIEEAKPLEDVLESYQTNFDKKYVEMMSQKLGLAEINSDVEELIENLEQNLQLTETDITIFFRELSSVQKTNTLQEAFQKINKAFYKPLEITESITDTWLIWFSKYIERLQIEKDEDKTRKLKMNEVNPKFVLRNYMSQLAIDAANKGNYKIINELYTVLKRPYHEQPEYAKWYAKRPEWARNKVGCSMLSCSS
ncbi:protein adenylyltransferase SelO [uncultured Kordia sp.]|uniref:protein adenylyltransferase SelO n=1 Tax=uncultured Kordia sp. TaxID=507699 RepID=UPI0026326480|nr:YdiU family protein [uncultured Kordia sp.]